MTPRTGQMAPAFSGRSDQGEALGLEGLTGSWAVLAFLPRAGTPGSVLEVQGFEQALPAFAGLNARVVGVSAD
ncbi:MAG: redoxin domain-containing protein, partial [Deinococcus sp.]